MAKLSGSADRGIHSGGAHMLACFQLPAQASWNWIHTAQSMMAQKVSPSRLPRILRPWRVRGPTIISTTSTPTCPPFIST